jgi:hypothetical protein
LFDDYLIFQNDEPPDYLYHTLFSLHLFQLELSFHPCQARERFKLGGISANTRKYLYGEGLRSKERTGQRYVAVDNMRAKIEKIKERMALRKEKEEST